MKQVLVIYDKVAESFHNPFFTPNLGVAFRMLRDEISRGGESNALSSHTTDFALYEVGVFEEDTGQLTTVNPAPRFVCELASLVSAREEKQASLAV